MSLSQFLNHFPNKNRIFVYNDGNTQRSPMRVGTLSECLRQNAVNKRDVYFYVNSGGTKIADITQLNASFIDLDAGRDSNGKYLTVKKVNLQKQRMMKAINNSPIKPTSIVETRNGYHIYWVYKKPVNNIQKWNILQNKIANHFKAVGADSRAMKANQLMRVPDTLWYKPHEQCYDTFKTRVISTSAKVDFDDIVSAFSKESTEKPKTKSSFDREAYLLRKKKVPSEQKPKVSTQEKLEDETLLEAADLLKEVGKLLSYGDSKFTSKQCYTYAEKLRNLYLK